MSARILLLSRYTRLGASSRLRTLQYVPHLERAGFTVEVNPFFDDAYLQSLYAGRRRGRGLLRHFRKRMTDLRRRPAPDLIWLEYEALPWWPWMVERALLPSRVPVVVDYDDAIFHRYDSHRLWPVRWLLGRKIDRIMASAALVTAGNPYLSRRARDAGARRVEGVPTVVQTDDYRFTGSRPPDSRPRVGWIGTPQTWAMLASPCLDVLRPVLDENDADFIAIGASTHAVREGRLDIRPWSESSEVELLHALDVGVMPLPDTPWARGKCGYKLIQYMACGLPVVASPVGVNAEIVEHGVNGFLARTEDEWRQAVAKLLADPELRHRMGQAGRKRVESEYSLQVWAPRVVRMLREVAAT